MKRSLAGSNLSTRPCSPTTNSSLPAGRKAYRFKALGLSVRSSHGVQLRPPSSVRKIRLKAPTM
ncbi:hypothetical protein D9M72_617390 [compost metagenome]